MPMLHQAAPAEVMADTAEMTPEAPLEAAQAEGLHYVGHYGPGIRRRRRGKHFTYLDPQGQVIEDDDALARIRKLGIPPAWTDVWINPDAQGHIQATGVDARGRKQYKYHARWNAHRQETKFARMRAFGMALPKLRAQLDHDLALSGLPHDKVVAIAVNLLEETFIRVGNEEYRRQNKSVGLTTMRDRNVEVEGGTLKLHFRGKSGIYHEMELHDRRLARLVKRCQDLPGHELFQYQDADGQRHPIGSHDVNEYIHKAMGERFTAKDFRTWAGTVLAIATLRALQEGDAPADPKKAVSRVVAEVSQHLGNTPTVCRKYYIHPTILDSAAKGQMDTFWKLLETAEREVSEGLSQEEIDTLLILQQCEASSPTAAA